MFLACSALVGLTLVDCYLSLQRLRYEREAEEAARVFARCRL